MPTGSVSRSSTAYRDAELLRGEGDAQAAETYAKAFEKNAEFYSFWRSLTAYRDVFSDGGSMMVLDPESEFFRYFGLTATADATAGDRTRPGPSPRPFHWASGKWTMVSIWENSRRLVIMGLPVVTGGRTDNGRVSGNLRSTGPSPGFYGRSDGRTSGRRWR